MTLDYYTISKVQIKMSDCIMGILESLPPRMDGESATSAANHLFTINTDAKILEPPEAEMFHHYVAKLLFLCKQARPDIQMAIASLSTQVNTPDQDYGV